MIKYLAIVLLSALTLPSIAQTKTLPAEARSFVLKGQEMLDYITGDLNGDKKPDAILILKRLGEDTTSDFDIPRPFLILIRQTNGKLTKVLQNDSLVLCSKCGGVFGDPYESTTITKNGFTIQFYGGSSWRWGSTYRFVYRPAKNNWFLVNEKQLSYQTGDPEKTTKEVTIEELELGEVPVDKFSNASQYAEAKWKVTAVKTFFYDAPKLGNKPRKGYLLKGNTVTGLREFKNFVEVNFEGAKERITTGYVLKKDLVKLN